MKSNTPNLRTFYLLVVGLGSILAHVGSEFAGMGSDADHLLFSLRHLYLGIAALALIVLCTVRLREMYSQASNKRDLKRRLELALTQLPLGGRGIRYYLLTAGLQLAIGSVTEIGEACPLCGHDIAMGVIGALCTVLLFALVGRLLERRLPSLVVSLGGYLPRTAVARTERRRIDVAAATRELDVWFPLLFNRPPPLTPATAFI